MKYAYFLHVGEREINTCHIRYQAEFRDIFVT